MGRTWFSWADQHWFGRLYRTESKAHSAAMVAVSLGKRACVRLSKGIPRYDFRELAWSETHVGNPASLLPTSSGRAGSRRNSKISRRGCPLRR